MSYLPTTALPHQMPWLTSTVTTDPTRWPYTNNKRSWFIRSDPTNYAISVNAAPFRGFFDFSFLRVTPPKQQPYSLLIFPLALLFLQPKNDRIVDFYLDSEWVNTLPREFVIHCHTLLLSTVVFPHIVYRLFSPLVLYALQMKANHDHSSILRTTIQNSRK